MVVIIGKDKNPLAIQKTVGYLISFLPWNGFSIRMSLMSGHGSNALLPGCRCTYLVTFVIQGRDCVSCSFAEVFSHDEQLFCLNQAQPIYAVVWLFIVSEKKIFSSSTKCPLQG